MQTEISHRQAHKLIFLISGVLTLALSSYGIVGAISGHVDVVGAVFVTRGLPLPLGLQVEPITILMAAALGLAYSGYELGRSYVMKNFGRTQFTLIELFSFIVMVMSGYEILYNFAIWISQISTSSLLGFLNPDILVNQFPNPKTPWNLVFATEFFTIIFMISVYTFYYIRQVQARQSQSW